MTAKERFRRLYERFALNCQFSRKNFLGGYAGTADRLREALRESAAASRKARVSLLAGKMKEEAGTGGYCGPAKAGGKTVSFSEQHDAKGISLWVGRYKFSYTWKQVAGMVLDRGIFDEER